MSKQTLAVELSKFMAFDDANQKLEQYSTDSEVAADILWSAHMQNWIKDKTIVDLGAGTGILGLGCLLLGAKKVIFVEVDRKSIDVLQHNLAVLKESFEIHAEIEIKNIDIKNIDANSFDDVDLVVQNPPFGTQEKNMDSFFLEKAFVLSKKVITMHKTVTKTHIEDFAQKHGFSVFRILPFNYPLKKTLPQHKKDIEYIKVSCWFLVKG